MNKLLSAAAALAIAFGVIVGFSPIGHPPVNSAPAAVAHAVR